MQTIGKRVCPACGALVHESDPCPVCLLRSASNPDAFVFSSTTGSSRPEHDFEHYRVLLNPEGTPIELGRGAMGVTYKAFDINLRCVVALKVINVEIVGDQSACGRFVREARAAARVRDANVASVFHLGKHGLSYFYAMEFVDGEPLDKVIRRAGRLEPTAALRVIRFVATGLEAIARQNLVHRDIKPSNIMVRLNGDKVAQVKIIDLGLAKSAVEDDAMPAISNPGSFAGTPAYASPEQFAGIGADIRSDLYSLGITLWELLCGELPFRGSAVELSDQHQYAPLPMAKLNQIPLPIVDLLGRLLKKDACRRFQRPAELVEAVVKILEPEEWRIATDSLVVKTSAVHLPGCLVNKQRVVSDLERSVVAWLLPPVIGVLGLAFVWHTLPAHVRSLIDSRDKAPVEQTIAVLPFENLSSNQEDVYFADGVHDEILRELVSIVKFKVVSRTSVMQYRGGNRVDLRNVANALGVTIVVEGTVRRDGNHVRVSTALVDARNDNLIWMDSYDRDLIDVFATESEIARQVAAKLSVRFSAERRAKQPRMETNPHE
jgi:serine/threonine protein kinase